MREILRLETNIPKVVALAFDKGVPVEGQFGDQVRFTLEDDRIVYVDPPVAQRIEELGIRRGEEFQLCKRPKKGAKGLEVEVVKLKCAAAGTPAAPQAAKREGAAAVPATVTGPVQSSAKPNGAAKANGNGAPVPVVFTGTGAGDFLLSALVNSVDIWLATQQYAKAKGLDLAITTEDVRALAITAFINTRGGR